MFSDEIVENAWMRARSCCECERAPHGHRHRCGKPLVWPHQGKATTLGGWQAVRTGDPTAGGWDAVNACEILCWACYRAVMAEAAQKRAA